MHRSAWVMAAIVLVAGCSSSDTATRSGSSYPQRTKTVDGIEISATPIRIDQRGATFDLAFNSHSASFDAHPRQAVTLDVDGARWTATRWNGDPPDGQHRAGTLSFSPGGPPKGSARLVIGGVPRPVTFTWKLRVE